MQNQPWHDFPLDSYRKTLLLFPISGEDEGPNVVDMVIEDTRGCGGRDRAVPGLIGKDMTVTSVAEDMQSRAWVLVNCSAGRSGMIGERYRSSVAMGSLLVMYNSNWPWLIKGGF